MNCWKFLSKLISKFIYQFEEDWGPVRIRVRGAHLEKLTEIKFFERFGMKECGLQALRWI